eukprot:scaffold911_cov162-Ochromonas_danica.AAC.7
MSLRPTLLRSSLVGSGMLALSRSVSIMAPCQMMKKTVLIKPCYQLMSSKGYTILSKSSLTTKNMLPTATSSSRMVSLTGRQISTMKRRRTKMNKHKLRKRSKDRRMNTKASRAS